MGSYHLKGIEFQFDLKSSVDGWLHNRVNVFNATELYTQKG